MISHAQEETNAGDKRLLYLYLLEHVRVVTDLPQLHDGVHQRLCASFTLVNTMCTMPVVTVIFFHFTFIHKGSFKDIHLDIS